MIDSENTALIFADDPLLEEKLHSLLTERGPRPVPFGLPVGFIAWTRGDGEAAAVRSDLTEAGAAGVLVVAERGNQTAWFAMIPMREYADERKAAIYIKQVFQAAGAARFLGPRPGGREVAIVRHEPFQDAA